MEQGDEARRVPIVEGAYKLNLIDPSNPFSLYAGMDSGFHVMLAIGTSSRPPTVEIKSSALDYFRQQRTDGSWLMVLRLQLAGLEQVFGRLCQDLVDAAVEVKTEKTLIALFMDRLDLWKRLFQNTRTGLLEKYQIKGLIAELLTLDEVLRKRDQALREMVSGWVGPLGSDQDFQYSNSAIEVKAISPDSEDISIASLGQLQAAVPIELRVLVLREVSPTDVGSINLPDSVARIEGLIAADPEALEIFRDRLLEVGYVEHEYYESVAVVLQKRTSFLVSEGFPRLTASQVPAGIVGATYTISLSSIQRHIIA